MLTLDITGGTERAPHRVTGHDGTRNPHCFGDMPKRPHIHGNCRNTGSFDLSCDMSDRHEADRSDGHQEQDVDVIRRKLGRPLLRGTFHPPLCGCPGE